MNLLQAKGENGAKDDRLSQNDNKKNQGFAHGYPPMRGFTVGAAAAAAVESAAAAAAVEAAGVAAVAQSLTESLTASCTRMT